MLGTKSPHVDLEQVLYRFMVDTYAGFSKRALLEFLRFDFAPEKFSRMQSMTREKLTEIYCRNMAARIVAQHADLR